LPYRIARHAVEHQITQGSQQLDIDVALPTDRIGLSGAFVSDNQLVELVEQKGVAEQSPTVSL
jgi:hypothetical protein